MSLVGKFILSLLTRELSQGNDISLKDWIPTMRIFCGSGEFLFIMYPQSDFSHGSKC